MEVSVVIDDDSIKVKFKDGDEHMELSRSQLSMGLRFLDAAEGAPTNTSGYVSPANITVHNPPAVMTTTHQPIAHVETGMSAVKRPVPPPARQKSNLKKVKKFAESINSWQKEYEETNENKKAGGLSEWSIKKAIVDNKGEVSKEEMFQVLKQVQGREMFDVFYETAAKTV